MYEEFEILKELKGCYPGWFNEIKEIAAIQYAQLRLLEKARDAINLFIANRMIYSADERTLRALEAFLRIDYCEDRGELERRRLIASHFVGNGRFGRNEILEIAGIFTAAPCNVKYSQGIIDVEILRDIEDTFLLNDCVAILNKRKPAQLALNVILSSPFSLCAHMATSVSEYRCENIS